MCYQQVSWAGDSGSLIGHLSVTFAGALNFHVAYSFDGVYLGPFNIGCLPNCGLLMVCLCRSESKSKSDITSRESNIMFILSSDIDQR